MNPTEIRSLHATVMDVESQRIGRVYAEALLRSAGERHEEQEVYDELQALVGQVFQEHPEIEALFDNAAVSREQKEKLIRDAFSGRSSDTLVRFLLVLNEHDRLNLLRAVLMEYRGLLDQRLNRVRVLVRSATALTGEQQDRLKQILQQRLGREPILEMGVDPSLLGGLMVRVGDELYDGSVRSRLDAIRNQLIERSSHEIQSGRDRFRSDA
jgi:F-type H+-transporting ATPase subunit delta